MKKEDILHSFSDPEVLELLKMFYPGKTYEVFNWILSTDGFIYCESDFFTDRCLPYFSEYSYLSKYLPLDIYTIIKLEENFRSAKKMMVFR